MDETPEEREIWIAQARRESIDGTMAERLEHQPSPEQIIIMHLYGETQRVNAALDLGWTRGQYEWALNRWHHYDEDYLSPNLIVPPDYKCDMPKDPAHLHG